MLKKISIDFECFFVKKSYVEAHWHWSPKQGAFEFLLDLQQSGWEIFIVYPTPIYAFWKRWEVQALIRSTWPDYWIEMPFTQYKEGFEFIKIKHRALSSKQKIYYTKEYPDVNKIYSKLPQKTF